MAGGPNINKVERNVLTNAANAITEIVGGEVPSGEENPLIAASMIGITTPCVREDLNVPATLVMIIPKDLHG